MMPTAKIDGNLDYYSNSRPRVEGTVAGTTTGHALPRNNRAREANGSASGVFAVF